MNTIRVTTPQNIEIEYDLASLGERMVGYLIDRAILAAYVAIVAIILFSSDLIREADTVGFLLILPIFFYDLLSEILMNGQTVGKKAMRIRVINLAGEQAGIGQYVIRWLFRLIDFYGTFNLCALISVAISERKQRVGDMVAGTTIIKTAPRTNFQQTIYTPPVITDYAVTFPEVMNLEDRDMQLVREVVNRVQATGNLRLAHQAAEKIKERLNIQSNMDPAVFLNLLLSDYNHLTSQ